MAQVSYGTITITDTTDIERIYPIYCKGDLANAPSISGATNWNKWKELISQAGGSGDYIWQRIVTKKVGVEITYSNASQYCSDAVRLTGEAGISPNPLTITSTQYAQTANENDTPSYGNTMPSSITEGYWLWVKVNYSDGNSVITKIKQGQKGDQGDSITGTRELYYLSSAIISNPLSIKINENTQIYTDTASGHWTSAVPSYIENYIYYTCIETTLSDNSITWSDPVINQGLTTSNSNALAAYNTSTARDTEVNALKAQAKYFWWDSDGAHIASGLTSSDSDNNIQQLQPASYGFNALTAPGFLKLRYEDIDYARLTTNGLTFYNGIHVLNITSAPTNSTGTATNGFAYTQRMSVSTIKTQSGSNEVLIGDALRYLHKVNNNYVADYFYVGYTNSSNAYLTQISNIQGKKAVELSTDALTFYKPLAYNSSSEPTAAATLNTNGLILSEGGVQAGTAGQSGFIYLSTKNYGSNLTINSHQASNWREIIGTKFGIDADGNLYASNAEISGKITVDNGSNVYTKTEADGAFDEAGAASAAQTAATNAAATDATNKANEAAKTATNYLSYDTTNGLKIAQSSPSGATTNYIQITSSNINIVKSSTYKATIDSTNGLLIYAGDASNAVAQFGSTMRIGKANDSAFHINPSSLQAYYMNGTTRTLYFEVTPTGIKYGPSLNTTVATTSQIPTTVASLSDSSSYALKTYADEKADAAETNAKTAAQGYADTAEANASYSVEIQVTAINYVNNSATLVAIPYYQGSTTMPEGVTLSYRWYKNGTALENISTAPTISGVTTNTLQLGQGTDFGSSTTNAIYTCVIS